MSKTGADWLDDMLLKVRQYLKENNLEKISWYLSPAEESSKGIRGDLGLCVATDGREIWFEQKLYNGFKLLSQEEFPKLYKLRANMFATIFKKWYKDKKTVKLDKRGRRIGLIMPGDPEYNSKLI